jgi:prepilin-type N-terminal cleavage/methylation domain-containing protein
MTPHATARAYSLIEMVLVVAIAGIVAAVAVPRLGSGFPGSRLTGVENRLTAEFALVGDLARAQGRSHTIQFSIADDEMRVYEGTGVGGAGLIRRIHLSEPPYETSIVSTNITNAQATIVVDGFGMYASNAKVTVTTGGVHRTINLTAALTGGAVTMPAEGTLSGVGRVLDGLIGGLPVLGDI